MENDFSFGSLFSNTIDIFKEKFGQIIMVTLLLYVLPILVSTIFNTYVYVNEYNLIYEIIKIILLIVSIIFSIISTIIIIKFIHNNPAEFKLGNEINKAFKLIWGYICVSFRTSIFVLLWSLLLIIPGIIKSIQYAFSLFVYLIEGKKAKESMETSRALVKGRGWKVFGYTLLLGIIIMIIYWIIILLVLPLGIIPYLIAYFILFAITTPFSLIFMKKFYDALKATSKN